jgi:peroxiredoxin
MILNKFSNLFLCIKKRITLQLIFQKCFANFCSMTGRFIQVFFCLIIIASTGCENNTARISGSIVRPSPGEYLFLEELRSDQLVPADSMKIPDNGAFSFRVDVKSPSFYLLKFNNNNFLTLLVEPGQKIVLKTDHDSLNFPVSVEGSEGTLRMTEYNRELRKTVGRLKGLNRIYEENQANAQKSELMASIDSLANVYLGDLNRYTKHYIDSNIASLVSLVALYQQVAPGVRVLDETKDWKYFVRVDSSLYSKYPDYGPVTTLHSSVRDLIASLGMSGVQSGISTGAVAPDISLPTPQGDTVSLSSTRGSYVLLDFWASWCPPCRGESPNLVNAYDTYHRKGFQIFQVSLDKAKESWTKGIESDKLDRWIHVSDLQYWNSAVVPLYKIESIPMNFLLDREGKIIAMNLRGERLQQKLAEVFDK